MSTGCIWSDAGTFTVWLCALTTVEVLKTSATAKGLVGLLLPHPITYNAPATIGNAFPASITKVRLSTVTSPPLMQASTTDRFLTRGPRGAVSDPSNVSAPIQHGITCRCAGAGLFTDPRLPWDPP